jgi:hypothetical protein
VALQTEIEAERNVLRSPRVVLAKAAGARFVDRATKVFLPNTRVVCSSRPPRRKRAHIFVCTMSHEGFAVHFDYIATGRHLFRLVAK